MYIKEVKLISVTHLYLILCVTMPMKSRLKSYDRIEIRGIKV